MPDTAPAVKTELIRGAARSLSRSRPRLRRGRKPRADIARTRGYAEIPPFDDRRVIAGQGTIGLEIAEDLAAGRRPPPAAVLVPVGGGGMVSGIAVAIKALLPGTRVIGVEPELAADARESLRAARGSPGRRRTPPGPRPTRSASSRSAS